MITSLRCLKKMLKVGLFWIKIVIKYKNMNKKNMINIGSHLILNTILKLIHLIIIRKRLQINIKSTKQIKTKHKSELNKIQTVAIYNHPMNVIPNSQIKIHQKLKYSTM